MTTIEREVAINIPDNLPPVQVLLFREEVLVPAEKMFRHWVQKQAKNYDLEVEVVFFEG